MAAETGFKIDGKLHDFPTLDTFTLDEAQILYDYSGLTIEDFVAAEGEEDTADEELEEKLRNPGFLRAMMHIAYQRANPKLNPARVKAMVGSASLLGTLEHLAQEEDDAGPPASTSEPSRSSPRSSDGSSESSGDASTAGSDAQVVPLEATTTSRSGMSSTSPPISSAV